MEEITCLDTSPVFQPSPGKDYTPLLTPTERMSPSTQVIYPNRRILIPRLPRKQFTGRKLIFCGSYTSLEQSTEESVTNNKPLRGRPSAKDLIELHRLGADCKFKCSVCPMGFQRKKSLATHMLTHSAEKKHNCSYPECRKRFTQYSHLTTHWRVHTREKPFICTADNCSSRSTFKRGKCLEHPCSSFIRKDESTEDIMKKLTGDQENMSEAEVMWIIEHIAKKQDNIGSHQPTLDVLVGANNLLFYKYWYSEKMQNYTLNC